MYKTIKPVSYTHLDVYKRQSYHSEVFLSGNSGNDLIRIFFFDFLDDDRSAFFRMICI